MIHCFCGISSGSALFAQACLSEYMQKKWYLVTIYQRKFDLIRGQFAGNSSRYGASNEQHNYVFVEK